MSDKNAVRAAIVFIFFLGLIGIVVIGSVAINAARSNASDQCPQERDGMHLVIVVVRLASGGVIDCHYAIESEASE